MSPHEKYPMADLPKPPEKPTVRMNEVPDWAIKLTESIRELGREVRADIIPSGRAP